MSVSNLSEKQLVFTQLCSPEILPLLFPGSSLWLLLLVDETTLHLMGQLSLTKLLSSLQGSF